MFHRHRSPKPAAPRRRGSRAATALLLAAVACWTPSALAAVCRDIPTATDDKPVRDAFDAADVGRFMVAGVQLEADLNAVCSGTTSLLFHQRVKHIVILMAAGATEPTAYLRDRTLTVEFFGGPYDSRRFRKAIDAALRGKVTDDDD